MARPPPTDPEHRDVWVCEECGEAAYGPNPPDECAKLDCGHRFFDNLHDLLDAGLRKA